MYNACLQKGPTCGQFILTKNLLRICLHQHYLHCSYKSWKPFWNIRNNKHNQTHQPDTGIQCLPFITSTLATFSKLYLVRSFVCFLNLRDTRVKVVFPFPKSGLLCKEIITLRLLPHVIKGHTFSYRPSSHLKDLIQQTWNNHYYHRLKRLIQHNFKKKKRQIKLFLWILTKVMWSTDNLAVYKLRNLICLKMHQIWINMASKHFSYLVGLY